MFSLEDAVFVANELGIVFDKFSIQDLIVGLNIELEHGCVNPATNVTNNDLLKTAKIALAHLNEFSNYYNVDYGLLKFEEFLKNKETEKNMI